MSGIQRDIQRQNTLFLQATTGVMHPSAKKYRALNDRNTLREPWDPTAALKCL